MNLGRDKKERPKWKIQSEEEESERMGGCSW